MYGLGVQGFRVEAQGVVCFVLLLVMNLFIVVDLSWVFAVAAAFSCYALSCC